MEQAVRQELLHIMEDIKNIHEMAQTARHFGFLMRGGCVIIVETESYEQFVKTNIMPKLTRHETADNLRQLRNEFGGDWLIICLSEDDIINMSMDFLEELQMEVRFGKSIIFVMWSFGWEAWMTLLQGRRQLLALRDCSHRFTLSV